jgi:hypothetical protein
MDPSPGPAPIASVGEMQPLVPGRACGGCDVCCRIFELDEPAVKKGADVLCPHYDGMGCSIYARRPDPCRAFFCLWRRVAEFSDALRPDRCGVIFRVVHVKEPRIVFEGVAIVAQAIGPDPNCFGREPVKGALEMLADNGSVPVWTSAGGVKSLYYPDLPLRDAILRPSQTPWQSLVPYALAWLSQYETILNIFM